MKGRLRGARSARLRLIVMHAEFHDSDSFILVSCQTNLWFQGRFWRPFCGSDEVPYGSKFSEFINGINKWWHTIWFLAEDRL
ncbi:hypothetical protein Sp245p_22340 (plasmid) [Azospirillum baldaniorum]|uniref:Uncharacterized protein n=1 Tax=Azospirillum baldaniorum TaxID=1064539 RepID=A0A9P1JWC1_9PROT|nr:hypothetical protein Sp245p_22340 [Azospirillum baldaniorum]CCD01051.1 protein of unknown function [Azospirillum baldaniorum]